MTVANRLQAETPTLAGARAGARDHGQKAGDGDDFFAAMREAGASQGRADTAKGKSAEGTAGKDESAAGQPVRNRAKQPGGEPSVKDVVASVADADEGAVAAKAGLDDETGQTGKTAAGQAGKTVSGGIDAAAAAGKSGEDAKLEADPRRAGAAKSAAADAASGGTVDEIAGDEPAPAGRDPAAASPKAVAEKGAAQKNAASTQPAAETPAFESPAEVTLAKDAKDLSQTNSTAKASASRDAAARPATTAPRIGVAGQAARRALHAPITAETDPELLRLRLLQAGTGTENPTVDLQLSADQVAERLGVLKPGEVDPKAERQVTRVAPRSGRIIVTVGRGEAMAEPTQPDQAVEAINERSPGRSVPLSPDAKLAAILGGFFGLQNRIVTSEDGEPAVRSESAATAIADRPALGTQGMTTASPAALRSGGEALPDVDLPDVPAAGAAAGSPASGTAGERPAVATGPSAAVPQRQAASAAPETKSVRFETSARADAQAARQTPAEMPAASATETAEVASLHPRMTQGGRGTGSGLGARVDLVSMRTDFEPATRRAERRNADAANDLPARAATPERAAAQLSSRIAAAPAGLLADADGANAATAAPAAAAMSADTARQAGAQPNAGQAAAAQSGAAQPNIAQATAQTVAAAPVTAASTRTVAEDRGASARAATAKAAPAADTRSAGSARQSEAAARPRAATREAPIAREPAEAPKQATVDARGGDGSAPGGAETASPADAKSDKAAATTPAVTREAAPRAGETVPARAAEGSAGASDRGRSTAGSQSATDAKTATAAATPARDQEAVASRAAASARSEQAQAMPATATDAPTATARASETASAHGAQQRAADAPRRGREPVASATAAETAGTKSTVDAAAPVRESQGDAPRANARREQPQATPAAAGATVSADAGADTGSGDAVTARAGEAASGPVATKPAAEGERRGNNLASAAMPAADASPETGDAAGETAPTAQRNQQPGDVRTARGAMQAATEATITEASTGAEVSAEDSAAAKAQPSPAAKKDGAMRPAAAMPAAASARNADAGNAPQATANGRASVSERPAATVAQTAPVPAGQPAAAMPSASAGGEAADAGRPAQSDAAAPVPEMSAETAAETTFETTPDTTADTGEQDALAEILGRTGLAGQPAMPIARGADTAFAAGLAAKQVPPTSQVADAVAAALVDMAPTASRADATERTRLRAGGAALKTIQIQLSPEKLGKVNVTLKLIEGNLTVHIEASEPDTALRLKDDSEGLKSLLKQAGLDVDEAMITLGSRDGSSSRVMQSPAQQADGSASGQARDEGSANGQSSGNGQSDQDGQRGGGSGARSSRFEPASRLQDGEPGPRGMGIDPSIYL